MANICNLILEDLNNYYDDEEEKPRKSSFLSKLLMATAGLGGAGLLASQTNTGKSIIGFGKAAYSKYKYDNSDSLPDKTAHGLNVAVNLAKGYLYGRKSPIMKNIVFPAVKQKVFNT